MLGRTHALSGAAAFTGLDAGLLHLGPVPLLTGAVLTAGAAVLPDLDHPGATVSRTFGVLTQALAWAIGKASGGHRHGTHSAAGAAVATGLAVLARAFAHTTGGLATLALLAALLLAAALRALRIGGHSGDLVAVTAAAVMAWTGAGLSILPWAVALGTAIHIAGDMLTTEGCPLTWPLTPRHCWLLPRPLRFVTGHAAERWAVVPALLATLAGAAVLAAHGPRPLCLRLGHCVLQAQPSQPPGPAGEPVTGPARRLTIGHRAGDDVALTGPSPLISGAATSPQKCRWPPLRGAAQPITYPHAPIRHSRPKLKPDPERKPSPEDSTPWTQ